MPSNQGPDKGKRFKIRPLNPQIERSTGPEPIDLSSQHESFPGWDRSALYDLVTKMYLDAWDDGEVAQVLSEGYGIDVTPNQVHTLRREAAIAAEQQGDPQIKRRWIYRYRNLTVNNLVKEYMFMEGKRNFLRAKRELADEIDTMVKNTPANKLVIAVNDALGRNNIGPDLIHSLVVYGRTAQKLERMVQPFSDESGLPVDEHLKEVARKVSSYFGGGGQRDAGKTATYAARLMNLPLGAIVAEDVEFLREYSKFADAPDATERDLMYQIMHGADMVASKTATPLERMLDGRRHEFTAGEIEQVIEVLKSSPVLDRPNLERLYGYAMHRLKELEEQQGGDADPVWQRDYHVHKSLEELLVGHFDIIEVRRFYGKKEILQAIKQGCTERSLQATLDTLNRLNNFEQVMQNLTTVLQSQARRSVTFPSDRYCRKRFGLGQVTRILSGVRFT